MPPTTFHHRGVQGATWPQGSNQHSLVTLQAMNDHS